MEGRAPSIEVNIKVTGRFSTVNEAFERFGGVKCNLRPKFSKASELLTRLQFQICISSSSFPFPSPMASSAPPPLPSLPLSTPVPAGSEPAAAPAVRVFLSRLNDSVRRSLSDRRPWSELTDRSTFSRPESFSEATSRLRKNLAYFRVNYAAVIAVVLAVSLVTNPFSLLVLLSLLVAWCLLYLFRPSDPPLVLFGRTFTDRETLGGLVLLSVLVIFLTSVGSVIVSALVAGAGIVAAHGAFRVPEDLFLDEQEPGSATGLLSFLGGAASSAASAAVPVRV